MSLDRTSTPDSVLVGEYTNGNDGTDPRMVKYDLDYTTRRLKVDANKVAKGSWAYCVNIPRMQGAVMANGKVYVSQSEGTILAGDLWEWTPGSTAQQDLWFFPKGPEDLSYDKRSGGKLYTVTEHPGSRYIVIKDAP